MATTLSPLRSDRVIWYARLLQGLFVLVVLGVTGNTASNWVNIWGCTVPGRLAWNVACTSLTLILLLYLIPTTGPLSKTPLWNRWVQLTLDAVFLVFWIAAAATSEETCSDLCTACGVGYWYAGDTHCYCVYVYAKRQDPAHIFGRAVTPKPITSGEDVGTAKILTKVTEITLRKGFDAVLVFLFALTLVYGMVKAGKKADALPVNRAKMEEQHENVTKIGEIVTETAVPGP